MDLGWVLAFLCLASSAFTAAEAVSACKQVAGSSCKCTTSSGFEVDLQKLSGTSFQARDPKQSDNLFYFAPCSAVKSPEGCVAKSASISVCQQSGAANFFDAGDLSSGQFTEGDPAQDTLVYSLNSTVDPQNIRTSLFTLICSSDNRLQFDKEDPSLQYNFHLYSTVSCVNGVTSKGLSTGSVLVILFFVFFALYWIGGFIFMKFVRRAEGREMIPNYEFWKELPLLIRDGIAFTARGCKGETTYEKI